MQLFQIVYLYISVAGYAIYFVLTTKGSWSEVLRKGVTPVIKPRLEAVMAEEKARLTCQDLRDVEMNIEADVSEYSNESDDSKKCLDDM